MQERLYAEGVGGGNARSLPLLQGMDTSGRDGAVRRVVGAMNPPACITSFKSPRTRSSRTTPGASTKALPPARVTSASSTGRSTRTRPRRAGARPRARRPEWSTRYDRINEFERRVVDAGTHLVKVMLHISRDEHRRERLAERLEDPHEVLGTTPATCTEAHVLGRVPGGVPGRAKPLLDRHRAAVVVVPGDRKWYRDWVLATFADALRDMNPTYPPPDFDVAEQRDLSPRSDCFRPVRLNGDGSPGPTEPPVPPAVMPRCA